MRRGVFFGIALFVPSVALANPDDIRMPTDVMVYDKVSGMISTVGPVEMDYGINRMSIETIDFNIGTGELFAPGSIGIVGPDSNTSADGLVLNTRTKSGRIGETHVKFGGDAFGGYSFARASSAELVDAERIIFRHAEYTACEEGLKDCDATPTWRLYSNRINNHMDDGSLYYTHALLYMWDVPVFYLPFFKNYSPAVKNKSGLLVPSFGNSSRLGYVYQQPVFLKLNAYNDMTITPMITSKQGQLFIGEYRTNQDMMTSTTSGSFKERFGEDASRWHVRSHNYFEFDNIWRAFANVERTSDDTYLRFYGFNTDPWLSTNFGLEGTYNRSYLTAYAYSYQDLRALQDAYTPAVLPLMNYRRISEPMKGGGFFDFNLNGAHVIRTYKDPQITSERNLRTSAVLRYNQPLRFSSGHLFALGLSARGDLYSLENIQTGEALGDSVFTGSRSRTDSSASLLWRYPLFRRVGTRTEIIEPMVQIVTSPKQSADTNRNIPNMDSKYMELEPENLFSENRFSGYDVFESGTRVNYGIKLVENYGGGRSASFFIGQNYNIDVPDDVYLENSGLMNGSGFSDIVASTVYSPWEYLRLGYKARFDGSTGRSNRNELTFFAGPPALNLTVNYVYLRNMFIEDDFPMVKDEINARISSQLTRRWRVYFGNRYDLHQNRDITLLGGAVYENNCFQFSANFVNEFTRDRDYVGDRAVYLSLTFRTLGTFTTDFGVGTRSGDNRTESDTLLMNTMP